MLHTQLESNSVFPNMALMFQGCKAMLCSFFHILDLQNDLKPSPIFQILHNTKPKKRIRNAGEKGYMILNKWFLAGVHFGSQGTFGNIWEPNILDIWKHFWLLQLGRETGSVASNGERLNTLPCSVQSPEQNYLTQNVNINEAEKHYFRI